MKINRQRLLDAVNAALVSDEAAHAQRIKDWEVGIVTDRTDWVAANNPLWADAVVVIKQAIRKNEPVTRDMLPGNQNRWGDRQTAFFSEPDQVKDSTGRMIRKPLDKYSPDRDLTSLKSALEFIADEEVTTTGLKAVGVNPTVMRSVLNRMGS